MNRDLTRGVSGIFIWGVPVAVLAISAHAGGAYPTVAWPLALGFMGVVCLINARRCDRTHCYFSGPFFLVMALVSLLYGLGILDLGKRGWSELSVVLLIGTVVLVCVPEWLLGKYLGQAKTEPGK